MHSVIAWANALNSERVPFGDQVENAFDTGSAAGVEILNRRETEKRTPRWDVLISRNEGWAVKFNGELRKWHVFRLDY